MGEISETAQAAADLVELCTPLIAAYGNLYQQCLDNGMPPELAMVIVTKLIDAAT